MISIFDHFNKDLDYKQKDTLKNCGFDHLNDKMSKIMLMILYGEDKFEEKNIIEFKNLVELLKETNDPMKVLTYVNKITDGEDIEVNDKSGNSWRRKILTEFVCEFYGNKGCTEYGAKISQSLIRVAATRIFADPEQSIMELPVNSVDSYNIMNGGRSTGKFGMGFFSIFYWLSEPINGNFNRKMTIETRYNVLNENKIDGYKVDLKWTTEGLLVEKYILNPEEFSPNGIKGTTGTVIKLDFSNHRLTKKTIDKMKEYMQRLFLIEGAKIFLNGVKINQDNNKNTVNIEINENCIKIEDNASGIPFEILENSLLVPSSSTKKRDFVKDVYLQPLIYPVTNNDKAYFIILVNNVAVVKMDVGYVRQNFIIKLPHNSKLPVSRDDIIYTAYEIEYFKKACIEIINYGISQNNVIDFFIALNLYVSKNKSPLLILLLKTFRYELEKSNFILIPNTTFWEKFLSKVNPAIKNTFVMYDEPNMFNTERKLAPLLNPGSLNNIFKLRKIIFFELDTVSETGGLSEYLFISDKFKNSISSVAIKENRTLLIPCEDEYVLEVYTKDTINVFLNAGERFGLNMYANITSVEHFKYENFIKHELETIVILKQSYPNIIKTLSITKMSMIRKFENYKFDELSAVMYYLEKYTSLICTSFRLLNIDMNEVIPYLIDLNTKLMSYPISKKTSYGTKPEVIFNRQLSSILYVNSISGNLYLCEQVKKLIKDSITFSNDLFDRPKSMDHLIIPMPNMYLVSIFNHEVFFLYKELFPEFLNVIDHCNYPVETMTILQLFLNIHNRIDNEIKLGNIKPEANNNIKCIGLGKYLLEELKGKITPYSLMELHRENMAGTSMEFDSKIMNPLIEIGLSYINYITSKQIDRNISFLPKYTFTAKQLIEYLFNNKINIKEENNVLFQELSLAYPTYKRSEKKLQILEIAVNEGTTKGFIQSVLTELIQNSTDAIRSTEGIPDVDIFIGGYTISIKDYIGFDNLVNIMVPFLSSKDPNDPNVTGEMGSGFFNVYRQPFIKEVIVVTVFNGKRKMLKAIPLVENNNVYDIIYNIEEYETHDKNSSEVTLVFHNDIGMVAELVAEATIFTNCYLSFIPGINLKCNNKRVQKEFNFVFEAEGMKFYTVDDIITSSYVMTNGIPLMSMNDFMTSFDNEKISGYDIKEVFQKFCQNSVILDISKDVYTPTQARNKIQFKSHVNVNNFTQKLLAGFYYSIMDLYLKPSYKSMRDTFFPHSSSSASPGQLKVSANNNISNFLLLYGVTFEIDEQIFTNIREYIEELTSCQNKPELKYKIKQNLVTLSWFSNKNYPEQVKKKDKFGNKLPEIPPPVPFTLLQPFIDLYWEKINILYKSGIIKTKKFGRKSEPPKIVVGENSPSLKGFYNPEEHVILMNSLYYDPEDLRTELLKFKGKNFTQITTSWIMNPVIKKYFSTCIPTATLIHEFAHAVDGESHQNSSHGITGIKVRESDYLHFQDMAATIFQEAVGMGLLKEFLETVN